MSLLDPSFLRKLEALSLWARRSGNGAVHGVRSARSTGSGIAFAGHRAYAPGDDFRFIDFALYARSDRMYVKQLEEERELAVELLLDCSGSMADKLTLAKQLTGALGYLALTQLDRVALQPFAGEPLLGLSPLRGARRALLLLRHLDALSAAGRTDLPRAARAVRARSPRGGLSFVITDGIDALGLAEGVDILRHAELAPVVILLDDPQEAELSGELLLIDRETHEQRALTIDAALRARYRTAFRARRAALLHELRARQVPTFEFAVGEPVERAVLRLLRGGGTG